MNHLKNIWTILIYAICFYGLTYYLSHRFGQQDESLYNTACLLVFVVFLIPQITIHLTYYWLNEGRVLYYKPEERYLEIIIRENRYSFTFDDIKSIERNKSFALLGITYQWMPWDNYNYSVIRLKNGQQFVITSLLVPNMDLPLEEGKIQIKKRFYAYPFSVKEVLDVHI